jgi:probable HAF family extracellular repeat protein
MPSCRLRIFALYAALVLLVAGCSEPANAPLRVPADPQFARSATDPTVKAATPTEAPLDTTLDVQVSGSGFGSGSRADWLLDGTTDSRVRTNSTRFVNSTSLIANITIAADAVPSSYDVAVTNTSGKTGIGTDLFTVAAMELLSGPTGESAANDVSGTGIIAGGRAGGCDSGRVPAYWRNGGPYIDLPLLAPWCNGTALYINESGVMIGRLDPSGSGVAVRWVPNAAAPGGYDVSAMNPPPDGTSAAFFLDGLNENGVAIGNRWHGSTTVPYSWSQSSGWTAIPITAGTGTTGCYVEALDDVGEATGECWGAGGFGAAVFWSALDLPPTFLPQYQDYTFAGSGKAINNSAVVVGNAMKKTKTGGLTVFLRWTRRTDGTWNSPEVLTNLDPWDINDDGTIVGSTMVSSKHHAALLVPGQPMKDLGTIGGESWAFAVTPAGAGQVLVIGVTTISNYKRGTLWRPQ